MTEDSDELGTLNTGGGAFFGGNISARDITARDEVHGDKFSISGSGNIRSFALISNNSSVNISGSGDADVFVNQHLDADISGSGKIRYQGNATVSTSISGSGNVTHIQ